MKKLKIFTIFIAIFTFITILLTSCGGGDNSGNTTSSNNNTIILSDSKNEGSTLNYTYKYGQELSFITNLKIYYVDSTTKVKTELSKSEYDQVTYSYSLPDGTKASGLTPGMSLNVGYYSVEIKYKNYPSLYINLTITPGEVSNYDYSFKIMNKEGTVIDKTKYGTGKITDNVLESDCKVSIIDETKTGNDKYIKKNNLENIFCLTQDEYYLFTYLSTNNEKQEYLSRHEFVDNTSRIISYNNDGSSDIEFYINTSENVLEPGTYYMFAKIGGTNFTPFYTYPSDNTKLTIEKNTLSLKDIVYDEQGEYTYDEIIGLYNFYAEFDYNSLYYNNISQEMKHVIGSVQLGFIENVGGLKYNFDNEFVSRLKARINDVSVELHQLGEFSFENPYLTVDSNTGVDGVSMQSLKFELNDYYEKYYECNDVFEIPLTITKGEVTKPYVNIFTVYDEKTGDISLSDKYEFNYTGEEISFIYNNEKGTGALMGYQPELMMTYQTYDNLKATEIGEYYVKFVLIDDSNYVFKESTDVNNVSYGDSSGIFTWKIAKAISPIDCKYSYNGEEADSTQAKDFIYDREHNTVSIEVVDRNGIFSNRTINWELDPDNMPRGVDVTIDTTTHGLTNTVTYNKITDYMEFDGDLSVLVNITVEESDLYEEGKIQIAISLKSEYTEDEINKLVSSTGDIPATLNDSKEYIKNANTYVYYNANSAKLTKYSIKSNEYPPISSLSTLGSWKMYFIYYPANEGDDETYEVETTGVGWDIPNYDNEMNWALSFRTAIWYIFTPTSGLLPGFKVKVDTNNFDKYIIADVNTLYYQLQQGTYYQVNNTWTWKDVNGFTLEDMTPGQTFFFRNKLTAYNSGSWRMNVIANSFYSNLARTLVENDKYYITYKGEKKFELFEGVVAYTKVSGSQRIICYSSNIYSSVVITENEFTTDGTLYILDNDNYIPVKSGQYDSNTTYYKLGDYSLGNFDLTSVMKFYNYGLGDIDFFDNQDTDVSNDGDVTTNAVTMNQAMPVYQFDSEGVKYAYFAIEFNEALAKVNYEHYDGNYSEDCYPYIIQYLYLLNINIERI